MLPPSPPASLYADLVALACDPVRGRHTLPPNYAPGPTLRELPGYPENWTCWRPEHRDSDALARSNAQVAVAMIHEATLTETAEAADQFIDAAASHWLVGHVREIYVCLLREARAGEDAVPEEVVAACGVDPDKRWHWTAAAVALMDVQARLEQYPILDESDYSEVELEEQLEELRYVYPRPRVEEPWPVSLEQIHSFICEVRSEFRADPVLAERALLAGGAVPDEGLVEQALRLHGGTIDHRGRWHRVLVHRSEEPCTPVARRRSRQTAQRIVDRMTARVLARYVAGLIKL